MIDKEDHIRALFGIFYDCPLIDHGKITKDSSYENTQYAQFDTFFEGLFEKERFLDILKNFICFNVDGQNTFKILAGYHQYFGFPRVGAFAGGSLYTGQIGRRADRPSRSGKTGLL